jgi:hypothetical protein
MKNDIYAQVSDYISYDPDTGVLTWKKEWKGKKVGDVAGFVDQHGYRNIVFNGQTHKAHRLAWKLVHGTWPKKLIDHINQNKDDNRLCNLRECDHQENSWNRKKQRNNTSGMKGVTWNEKNQRWVAQIKDHGVPVYLGSFKNKVDAGFAYQTYAAKMRGEYHSGQA